MLEQTDEICRGSILSELKDLTKLFESQRSHLRAVAYRILGSAIEADDAVQEAWLRLNNADTNGVGNLGGWLTTVVGAYLSGHLAFAAVATRGFRRRSRRADCRHKA